MGEKNKTGKGGKIKLPPTILRMTELEKNTLAAKTSGGINTVNALIQAHNMAVQAGEFKCGSTAKRQAS